MHLTQLRGYLRLFYLLLPHYNRSVGESQTLLGGALCTLQVSCSWLLLQFGVLLLKALEVLLQQELSVASVQQVC